MVAPGNPGLWESVGSACKEAVGCPRRGATEDRCPYSAGADRSVPSSSNNFLLHIRSWVQSYKLCAVIRDGGFFDGRQPEARWSQAPSTDGDDQHKTHLTFQMQR